MTEKECLLEFIERINAEKERLSAEKEIEKIYGAHWKTFDYRARQSLSAGKICLLVFHLEKLELKANRRPHSIGARKARQKAKATRRELRNLEQIISQDLTSYSPTEPQYLSADLHLIWLVRKSRIKIIDFVQPEPEPVSGS